MGGKGKGRGGGRGGYGGQSYGGNGWSNNRSYDTGYQSYLEDQNQKAELARANVQA